MSGCLAAGCHSASARHTYPQEPMLLSKSPVDGQIEGTELAQAPPSEPQPPPLPAEALATIPRPMPVGPATPLAVTPEPPPVAPTPPPEPARRTIPAKTAEKSSPPPAAMPAARRKTVPVRTLPAQRSNEGPELPTTPAAESRSAPDVYGHETNYGWIQGVLDKHYRGHLFLRYCDPTIEDRWGGKVRLEPDSRLSEFKEGDVLWMEGTLTVDEHSANQSSWLQYPRYRIKTIRLIQSANRGR
jgi:hypothetical protein